MHEVSEPMNLCEHIDKIDWYSLPDAYSRFRKYLIKTGSHELSFATSHFHPDIFVRGPCRR